MRVLPPQARRAADGDGLAVRRRCRLNTHQVDPWVERHFVVNQLIVKSLSKLWFHYGSTCTPTSRDGDARVWDLAGDAADAPGTAKH